MNKLENALKDIGADCLLQKLENRPQWLLFCEQYEALFRHVCTKKPNVTFTYHLLGLLTKAHIDAQTTVENNRQAIQAMQETFSSYLESDNAKKFKNSSLLQLEFITQLWLYLQGYLKMDFSLANDHAEQTALIISAITHKDSHMLRTQLLSSFYAGAKHSPIVHSNNALLSWLKSVFKF